MKYLKKFESTLANKFKVGDYVYFDNNSTDEDDNIVLRKNYPYEIKTLNRRMIVGSNLYSATIICDDNAETIINLTTDTNKMSKRKAKMILNANKFNI
jgi:hypothetical protein